MPKFPASSNIERIIAIVGAVALGLTPVAVHFGMMDTDTGAYIGSILGALVASFHGTSALAARSAVQAGTQAGVLAATKEVAAQALPAPTPDRGGQG